MATQCLKLLKRADMDEVTAHALGDLAAASRRFFGYADDLPIPVSEIPNPSHELAPS